MNFFIKTNRGFTLIELLVVISIIGLLSSVVLASLNSARGRSRDTARMRGMREIQNALNLYYLDNGSYPAMDTWGGFSSAGCGYSGTLSGASGYIPNLAPTYIRELPRDPSGSLSACTGYQYVSNGTDYKLIQHVTPERYFPSSSPFYDPVRPTWAWALCSSPTWCASL